MTPLSSYFHSRKRGKIKYRILRSCPKFALKCFKFGCACLQKWTFRRFWRVVLEKRTFYFVRKRRVSGPNLFFGLFKSVKSEHNSMKMPWSVIETLLLRMSAGTAWQVKRAVLTTYWRTSQPLTAYMHVPAIVCRATRLNDHFDGHCVVCWLPSARHRCKSWCAMPDW